MSYTVVGLGNPGEDYKRTRHNAGRMAVDFIDGKVSGIKIFTPESYMNRTGSAIAKIIKSKKAAQDLIVIYDDMDLPLGGLKISYDRSSGGHKGLDSIIRALKTREFIRIRLGVSPQTPSGKIKKPKGELAVDKFILGEFKKPELDILKGVFKRVLEIVETIVEQGFEKAMNRFN